MALSRRTGARFQASIWPGFVDAMTGLLLVLMFVLTIFMVMQFVLQETITGQEQTISGQEDQLTTLSQEVASLAGALGLEQDRSAALGEQVGTLSSELSAQNTLIAELNAERDTLTANLSNAEARISGFEAQVAGLLIEQDTLNSALTQARDEIDENAEAARLAAARRDALEAMVADLETQTDAASEQISELETARLADAAAAQALRDRLENSDTELTAMTLALEEQRQQAEDTLTLLAAAQSAQNDLDANLAIALLAQQEAEQVAESLGLEREQLAAELANILDAQDATETTTQGLRDQLTQALVARTELEDELSNAAQERSALADELAAVVATLAAAQSDATTAVSEREARDALLTQANEALLREEALSAESQRQVSLLNEQLATLRAELGQLQSLLDLADDADATANVQIETLTQDLNTAMARALLAERRSRALEDAERERLAAEAVELERFRSDFLGLLRDVLEGVEGVRIEGDRFVFSSEVLFSQGAANLSAAGRQEIAKIADILRDVADEIPEGVDWVIRVDGHTDDVPVSGFGAFSNNWELSQARALSVVLYMVDVLGIPPERLAANGFGQYQPLNPDDTDEARAQNRRIELKLTER